MWYDILPSAAALITILYLPSVIIPYGQEFWTGNKWYKNTDFPEVRINWFRDMYITGDAHRPTRVDAIPDLPETNATQSE